MPTVFRKGAYRFFFFSADGLEPKHVHVERESRRAKIWLGTVRLQESGGFGRAEILKILALVEAHRQELEEAWDDFFGS